VTARLPEPPSAGVLLDALLAERQVRLDSIDAMTNKAGIMLGFTGAIVALTALLDHWPLRVLVFVPAAVAVWHCFKAFETVLLPGLNPATLRERALMQPPKGAQLKICDSLTVRHEQLVGTLTVKAERVNQASTWLVATIVVLAAASLTDGIL
jgi:hypothetical protein